MNKTEMAQVLTIASAIDNRKLSPEAVEAWFAVVGDFDYDVAVEAVRRHFRESAEYLIPNHITVIGAGIIRERERAKRKAEFEKFVEMRQQVLAIEEAKLEAGSPDADPDKVAALSRGEWRDEWMTGKEITDVKKEA